MRLLLNNFKILFSSGKKMPSFFMYLYGCMASAFIPIFLFGFWPWPSATYELNGESLSYSDFWLSGFAPLALMFSALMSYVCLCCAKGKPWSRWGIFLFWATVIALMCYGSLFGAVIGFCLIGSLWYYFFESVGVNRYYQEFSSANT